MPVLKVLIVTALGSFLALDSINILGQSSRKHINEVSSTTGRWFMPVNILLTFVIGSMLGWLLLIIARPPQHLKGLIIGTCAAGNLGNMLLIILPAVCKEKASPFGDPDIGAVYLWLYVYNLVRVFAGPPIDSGNKDVASTDETVTVQEDLTRTLLPSSLSSTNINGKSKVMLNVMKQQLRNFSRHINLKAVFAPSTIAAIVGFVIGIVAPMRTLLIGTTAPLRVIQDSASLVGDAAIPIVTLIVGGNLLRGLKGSGISLPIVFGIVSVKYVFLPVCGILMVKGAIYLGFVAIADPLYVFILLLQFAVPPAMNTGTIMQLFGVGESECSVIMLWTYGLASVSLSLWSTIFMWLVS
ncbi:putative membrane transport protein [Helianthus annuus]|nr:putative membrane transport protein [Helianthus annuus]KAJ0468782.1 putative membrane transport protein [Helianthus annuus]